MFLALYIFSVILSLCLIYWIVFIDKVDFFTWMGLVAAIIVSFIPLINFVVAIVSIGVFLETNKTAQALWKKLNSSVIKPPF